MKIVFFPSTSTQSRPLYSSATPKAVQNVADFQDLADWPKQSRLHSAHWAFTHFLPDKNKQRFCFNQVVGFDVRIPKMSILRSCQDGLKRPFFSLFLMREQLSSVQKLFLRPYSPQVRGMSVFKIGLSFSFQALEVPEMRVKRQF